MGTWREGTPGEGGEVRAEQFSYTRTPAGIKNSWTGWCAHRPYWCKAHEHNAKQTGTKVCLNWFTNGELACPRCRPGVIPTDVCYVPVWREMDHYPCMVITHESTAHLLADVEYGTFVLVGCLDVKHGVFVRRAEQQRQWRSSNANRQGPCDIRVSLLTMWCYPQLEQWLKQPRRAKKDETPDVPFAPTHRLSVPPPTTPTEALVINAHKSDDGGWNLAVEQSVEAAKQRARKAQTNGKHPPPNSE